MKHTLKWKLSLWFTLILTLITLLMGVLVVTVFRINHTRQKEEQLQSAVEEVASKLKRGSPDKSLKDEDFFVGDISLMIYDEDGTYISGVHSFQELNELDFSTEKEIRTISLMGDEYRCLDKKVHTRHDSTYYVRGICKKNTPIFLILKDHLYLLLILPLLLLLGLCGGYFLTGKFLLPIHQIGKTADQIGKSGDLTKRIEIKDTGDELSSLANTFNEMFDRVEDNFLAEKQFTSNASHELRTPVAVILANCEYGLCDVEQKEEFLDVLSSIEKQGHKMEHLIETLLLFTRIQQGTEKYPFTTVNLSDMVSSLCDDYGLIGSNNITMTTEITPGITLSANATLLELMVQNLLQNAYRYNKESGYIHVILTTKNHRPFLLVKDGGVGMSKDVLAHIWDRFYRSDASRNSKGMGLGLSLVKEIVTYHGGTIEVESKEGEGSIFSVLL
ncbi:MAG: HAMP domain-containing histidine kinase [Lachnospiraceae bacterium]|nr:HAMP domain-containing histidine kinase [Lachnospiraceae bacterium]